MVQTKSARAGTRQRRFLESLESRFLLSTASFAVVGDFGIAGTPEANVATLIHGWNPEFVITTGDNNYSTGSATTIDPNIGQYYHDYIGNYTGSYGAGAAGHNRFFPSLGNHDWGNVTSNPTGANPYLNYFTLPGTPTGADTFRLPSTNPNTNERYYTFAWGPVQFFAIDSDTNEPDGTSSASAQATWLRNALAASLDDASVKWRIVYFHHAAYSSGNSHGNNAYMQWPFAAWGATVVMSGHDHTYERISNPSDGLTYFVEGTGGNTLNGFISTPVAGSQVRYAADYGAMSVNASDTAITFTHRNRAGTLIDTYTINAPAAAPSAPTALAVSVVSPTQLGLTWTDNSATEQVTRIERSTDGINFVQVATVNFNVTSYTDSGLSPSTQYYYRLRGYNAAGSGAYSNVANNTTAATSGAPAAPTNALATAASPTQINVTWTDNTTNETSYLIERSIDGVTFSTAGTAAANAISFSDTGRTASTTYFYRIKAINTGVESVPSNVTSAKTMNSVSFVAAGATWKYLDNGTDQGTAWRAAGFNDSGWASGPAELGYGDGGEATVVSYGASSTNKYITTYFRRAFTAANVSQLSLLTLRLVRDDGAVVYLNGTEIVRSNMGAGTILYNTLAPSPAVGGTDESAFFTYTINPSSLLEGSNTLAVEIHQQAVNSTDISFNLDLVGGIAAPAAPASLTVTPSTAGAQVNLAWPDSGSTESGYRVERSTDGITFATLATLAANVTAYADTSVAVNTVYTYQVRATNLAGDSAPSPAPAVEVEEAIISGLVYDDADSDAIQDAVEFGLSGWTVYIDSNGNAGFNAGEPFAVTNTLGEWSIGGIFGGNYTVRIVPASGWTTTTPGAAYAVSVDNSANAAGRDFGEFPPATIGGTAATDDYTVDVLNGTHVRVWTALPTTGNPTYMYAVASINGLTVNAGGGADSLTFISVPAVQVTFNGGTGNDTLNVNGGTYSFATDSQAGTSALTVNVGPGAVAILNTTQHVARLAVDGGTVTLPPGADKVLVVKSLSLTNAGSLSLGNSDVIIDYTGGDSPLANIESLIGAGYNGGNWLGKGITSTIAAEDSGSYAVGALDNTQRPTPFTLFDGIAVPTTAVLVKFSWVADLDLDGVVTSNDAVVFANNYNEGVAATHRTGDLNYSGFFDSNDAILFANTYNESLPQIDTVVFAAGAAPTAAPLAPPSDVVMSTAEEAAPAAETTVVPVTALLSDVATVASRDLLTSQGRPSATAGKPKNNLTLSSDGVAVSSVQKHNKRQRAPIAASLDPFTGEK